MRPIALAGCLLCTVLLNACGDRSTSSAGAEAFERNCGACHTAANLPGTRAQSLADPQKRMALDQFLAQHHAADAAVRRQLIDHLAAQEK